MFFTSVFPGEEIFVRFLHPEKDIHFLAQLAPWTNYRVTTKITTKISTDVEKCHTVETDFDSLVKAYQEYGDCLTKKVLGGNNSNDPFGTKYIQNLVDGILVYYMYIVQ